MCEQSVSDILTTINLLTNTTTMATTNGNHSTPTMKVHPTNFTTKDKPWLSWPVELPRTDEHPEKLLQQQYHELNDPAYFSRITSEQRSRLIETLSKQLGSSGTAGTAVLLAGGTSEDFDLYDTDVGRCDVSRITTMLASCSLFSSIASFF